MKPPETTAAEERQDELELDQHLFDVFLNDHIENEILRLMECSTQNT